MHLPVLQLDSQIRREGKPFRRPAHFTRPAVSADRYIVRRRVAFFRVPERIEEDRDAPGNSRFPGMVILVGHCKASRRTASAQSSRTRVLQYEREAIRAMPK